MALDLLHRLLARARTPPPPRADVVRRMPAGTVAYAVGDIHGRLDLLDRLHGAIAADAAARSAPHRLLVYLGDYVDRGPDSAGVIARLLEAPLEGFERVHLIGNHERMMLDFLADTAGGGQWLRNGGRAALASYGVDAPELPDEAGLAALQAELTARLPATHRAFLEGLAPMAECGDYCFVHAGVRPGIALADQVEDDLLWIRAPFLETACEHGKLIVHGHTIRPEPEWRPWRIGIDTGAFSTGRLTALALEDDRQDFIQAVG